MAEQINKDGINTGISWTFYTLNLWWGCTEVHEGCDNCYARVLAQRWGFKVWGAKGVRRLVKWSKIVNKYQREAAAAGETRTVFVGSMMDIFEKPMPIIDSKGELMLDEDTGTTRECFFKNVAGEHYPNLLFLFLTKRPGNINKYILDEWKDGAPDNVMFGTSVVNQETADKLVPQLLRVNGRRFLSMEPLLGPVDLQRFLFMPRHNGAPADIDPTGQIEWIIVGGESGAKARPMASEWARSLRDQALAAAVKFHFKQFGEWIPFDQIAYTGIDSVSYKDAPFARVGKKTAGRLLDGVEYNATPLTA